VFDDTGSAGTVGLGTCNIGTIDMSARTTAMTIGTNGAPFVYGNLTIGSNVTIASTSNGITFSGRSTQTITSNGVSSARPITIDCGPGTVQLADALELTSARTLTLTSGTFDAVSYNVTAGLFNGSSATTKTLKMGSGIGR
jgi:hypothetical protein